MAVIVLPAIKSNLVAHRACARELALAAVHAAFNRPIKVAGMPTISTDIDSILLQPAASASRCDLVLDQLEEWNRSDRLRDS